MTERVEQSRRGRVLVVGPALADDPALNAAIRAHDVFDALGVVTVTGPREPIDLVIVEDDTVPGSARRVADAIRRVDPGLLIALAVEAGANGKPVEGFDAVLEMPLEAGRIAALRGGDVVGDTGDDGDVGKEVVEVDEVVEVVEEHGQARLAHGTAKLAHGTAERVTPQPAVPETPPAAVIVDRPSELGDVDLVEIVLAEDEPLMRTALDLIEQQSGLDVRLEAEPPTGDTPAAVEIAMHDLSFGWLCSERGTVAQLRPWAGWIARWLALEERLHAYRLMANRDDLTGAWNRRFFNAFMEESIERARTLRRPISVLVFDIDDFKQYNDLFGHQAGDVVLAETVRLLNSVIRRGDRVCRIGGDEFAVVFGDLEAPREAGSSHPAAPEEIAARFQDQICRMRFPKLGRDAPGPLSISAGLATFPWDGTTPQELLECADARALCSKRKGKNALTIGPEAEGRSERG